MVYTLIYVSKVTGVANEHMVENIREDSATRNQQVGISGVLLWNDNYFCQLLQGDETEIELTMQRIFKDPRHSDALVILRTHMSEALFPDWTLASRNAHLLGIGEKLGQFHQTGYFDHDEIDHLIATMQRIRYLHRLNFPDENLLVPLNRYFQIATAQNREALQQLLTLGAVSVKGSVNIFFKTNYDDAQWSLYAYAGTTHAEAEKLCREPALKQALQSLANGAPDTACLTDTLVLISADTEITVRGLYCENKVDGLENATSELVGILCTTCQSSDSNTEYVDQIARVIEYQVSTEYAAFTNELLKHRTRRKQFSQASVNYGLLDTVLNKAGNAIVAFDKNAHILFCNKTARELFNLHPNSYPIDWPKSIIFKDSTNRNVITLQHVLNETSGRSETSTGTNTYLCEKAESEPDCYLRVSASKVHQEGSTLHTVVLFDDVTEHEMTRERVRRSDRMEALGQLTSGIAHDFNNLLATLQNSVEMINLAADTEQRKRYSDIALDGVARGTQLTNRLLVFGSGNQVSADTPQVCDIIESIREMFASSIEPAIRFSAESVTGSLGVYCDRGQLENALLNLALNSKEAIVESGIGNKIELSVSVQQDSTIELSISDNGPGMSNEVLHKAIEPFFSTRKKHNGVGLGLAMVHQFAMQSGGGFSIDNKHGSAGQITGANSVIRLPSRPIGLTSEFRISTPAKITSNSGHNFDQTSAVQSGRQANILLVEDDLVLCNLLTDILQSKGYFVFKTHSPAVALTELKKGTFQLLLTDIVIPGELDGIELANASRQLHPELSVIYMSGYTDKNVSSLMGPVLKKPVKTETLISTIEKVLTNANCQVSDTKYPDPA